MHKVDKSLFATIVFDADNLSNIFSVEDLGWDDKFNFMVYYCVFRGLYLEIMCAFVDGIQCALRSRGCHLSRFSVPCPKLSCPRFGEDGELMKV